MISDEYAPFIFVNTGDSEPARLFTLLHELTHLWLNISCIPNHFITTKTSSSEEAFCNKVAAEILMPEHNIKKAISNNKFKTNQDKQDKQNIKDFINNNHKNFNVSKLAFLIRLKTYTPINKKIFEELKTELIKQSNEIHKKKKRTYKINPRRP